MQKLTPMMKQYFDIKDNHKDCILFFRLGDFYEMFFDDAITASRELEITLTGRDCGQEERAPMCGVPFHAAQGYIQKLVSKGYKVGICEQVEDVSVAKGIVKREVVKIVTPGTLSDTSFLEEKRNNYLMVIYKDKYYGICVVDITTGEMNTTSILFGNLNAKLIDEIAKYAPAEIIINSKLSEDTILLNDIKNRFDTYIFPLKDTCFEKEDSMNKIQNVFNDDMKNLLSEDSLSLGACGGMISYLSHTQKVSLSHIKIINKYKIESFMNLDIFSRKNLEITETLREKKKRGSLIGVLDKTSTSMGARMIRKWVEQPLLDVEQIKLRQTAVEEVKNNFMLRNSIKEELKSVYDIERLSGKLVVGTINSRDLNSFRISFSKIPFIRETIKSLKSDLLVDLYNKIDPLKDLTCLIDSSITQDPPITIKEGGIIKDGYNEEVDSLREATNKGKTWIVEIENREKNRTGIKNLKINYNKVFGYYIEVTKSHYNLVPDDYIRKQTLSNAERYITPELKEVEDKILGASEKLKILEYELFQNVKDKVLSEIDRIKSTAISISSLDAIMSLAEVAHVNGYCMPQVNDSNIIEIIEGRHPVIEEMIGKDEFVPNDSYMDLDDNRLSVITGPNMAGKSTYMRQVAVIVLMAQIGSFVPASSATIGVVDRIFTRVGASDDLATGQSTFMVEMSEMSYILENATIKSLLILDEVGRGTSTFDGLSIAWSCLEYISNKNKLGSRTLFATHYHELTELENKINGIKNYRVSVKKENDDIYFLHKIERGGADDSYGIYVAKLAGIPNEIISRSKELLKELETTEVSKLERKIKKKAISIDGQLDLFSFNTIDKFKNQIITEIDNIDLAKISPIDALNKLYDIQQKIKRG